MSEQLTYHQRVREEKREAIIGAATRLFLEYGFERTSLAAIAGEARVSSATLFKRFPTKVALFDAIVRRYWELEERWDFRPAAGNPRAGLNKIGNDYACLLTRPGMAALYRIVIAEASRNPELGRAQFDQGNEPFVEGLCAYLTDERVAGTLKIDDLHMAASQFLGMIADFVFWPRMLVVDYAPAEAEMYRAVDEAVETMLARYGRRGRRV